MRRGVLILMVLTAVVCFAAACGGAGTKSGTIAGTLRIAVACGTSPCPAPSPAARDIAVVRRDQGRVEVLHSGADGHFSGNLPAGDYALAAIGDGAARCQTATATRAVALVTVTAGAAVTMNIQCASVCLRLITPGQPATGPDTRCASEQAGTLAPPLNAEPTATVQGTAVFACPEHGAVGCGQQPAPVDILAFGPSNALQNATRDRPDGTFTVLVTPGPHTLFAYLRSGQEAGGGIDCKPAQVDVTADHTVTAAITC